MPGGIEQRRIGSCLGSGDVFRIGKDYLWVVIAKAEEKTFPLEPKKRIRDGRREENEEDKPVPEVEIEWH